MLSVSVCFADTAAENGEHVLPDGEYTVEDVPAYITFGFEDADSFATFLYYLNAYDSSFGESFEDYVQKSYPDYDLELAALLYEDVKDLSVEPLASGSSVTFELSANSGATTGQARWYYQDSVYGVSFYKYFYIKNIPVTGTTSNSNWPGTLPSTFTLDVAALSAGGCNWTTSQTAKMVSLTESIYNALRGSAATSIYDMLFTNQSPTAYGVLGSLHGHAATIAKQFSPGGVMVGPVGQRAYDWTNNSLAATTWDNATIPQILGYVYNQVGRNAQSTYQALWDTHNAMNSANDVRNQTLVDTLNSDLVSSISSYRLTNTGYPIGLSSGISTADLLAHTNTSIAGIGNLLFGGFSSYGLTRVTDFALSGDSLKTTTSYTSVRSIIEALGVIYKDLQAPLFQLQQVLASDEDMILRLKTADEVQQVTDDFTGDGQGAPDKSDIGDMAQISGDVSGMLDSGVGPGELVGVINGGDTYQFFSQEVADSLDTTANVGIELFDMDELFDLSDFQLTDDGLLVPIDDMFRREG